MGGMVKMVSLKRLAMQSALAACTLLVYASVTHSAQTLPTALEEVDAWWDAALRDGSIPSVQELAKNSSDPVFIRILDLVLTRYSDRGQVFLVQKEALRAKRAAEGSLLSLWGHAWLTWNCQPQGVSPAGEEDLRELSRRLSNDEKATLQELAVRFRWDVTGAIATRLLALREREGAFDSGGSLSLLAEQCSGEDSVSDSVIAMQRAREAESRGDWGTSAEYWFQSLRNCPFERELDSCRASLALVLSYLGEETGARFLAKGDLPSDSERDLIECLVQLSKAREFLKDGSPAEAARRLTNVMERMEGMAQNSDAWRKLAADVDLELTQARVAGRIGTATDEAVERLRTAGADSLTDILSKELAAFGSDSAFAGAVTAIIRKRFDASRTAPFGKCWLLLAQHDPVSDDIQAEAFIEALHGLSYLLNALRVMAEAAPSLADGAGFSMRKRLRESEESFLDLLEKAEAFARTAAYSAMLLDLVDYVYSCYHGLGIRNQPDGLYIGIAERVSRSFWRELIDHARKAGVAVEAVRLLEMLLEDPGEMVSIRPLQEDLLQLYIESARPPGGKKMYLKAAQLAHRMAESATDQADLESAWLRAADLDTKAGRYSEALGIVAGPLSTTTSPANAAKVKRLDAMALYHTGCQEEVLRMSDEMLASPSVSEQDKEFYRTYRVYSLILLGRYEEAELEMKDTSFYDDYSATQKEALERMFDEITSSQRDSERP